MRYFVTMVQGVPSSARRGIAFLESDGDVRFTGIDGRTVYEKSKESIARTLRSKFEYWIGGGIQPKYFHGWGAPDYRYCFTFKWKEAGTNHRLYGFLCHPRPNDVRFQACILVLHDSKNRPNTDLTLLDFINEIRVRQDIINACIATFAPLG
jgi:hypothetical protein